MRYASAALSLLFLALPAMAHPSEWRECRREHDRPAYAERWEAPRRLDPPWAARYEDRGRRPAFHPYRHEQEVVYVEPAPRLVIRPRITLWLGR